MSNRNQKNRDRNPPAELLGAKPANAPDEAVVRQIPPATNDPTRKINNPAIVDAKFATPSTRDESTLALPPNVAANRGTEPCVIAFVLIAAKPVEVGGKVLQAFG